MADKIVLITAQKPITGNYTYQPKPATAEIPKLVVAKPPEQPLVTGTENNLLAKIIVTNMGEEVFPNPQLFKRVHDYYQVNDTVTLTYRSVKFDQVAVNDTVTLTYRSVFQELQVTSDSYKVFVVNKGVRDTAQLVDQNSKRVQKQFSNLFNTADVPQVTYGKNLLNTVSVTTELVKLAYKKAANDLVTSTDILNRTVNFNRSFADVVDATDDFFGDANIDDDQIAQVGKTLVSWLTSTDVRAVTATKILQTAFTRSDTVSNTPKKVVAELVTSSDTVSFYKFANRSFNEVITAQSSGIINNQSYFAEDYVQPGYAGTNTIIS
jgi:hypothetical protein